MGGDVYPNRDVFGLINEPIEDGEGEMFTQIWVNDICWWRENCFGETRRVELKVESELTSRKLWYQQLEEVICELGKSWGFFKVKVSGV